MLKYVSIFFILSLLSTEIGAKPHPSPSHVPKLSSSQGQSCTKTPFHQIIEEHQKLLGNITSESRRPRVLVTGAAGFIASHVADFCQLEMKFHTVAVDDLSGGFLSNVETLQKNGGVFVQGSVQNVTFVNEVFAKYGPFDYVYHLAAYAAEGLSHFIRRYNYQNNLEASVTLINSAVNQVPQVKKFVFTSSIASYGDSDGKLPLTETSPQLPEDPYGISKLAVEMDLKAAHHMFGLDYIIFRPHNVYGPRQNVADKFRNVIGIFMNEILHNKSLTIFGDGTQRRAFSYIDDVAPLIAASVIFPTASNNGYFVGTDDDYTVKDLAYMVLEAMNSKQQVNLLPARDEVKLAFASHDKLRCHFNPPKPVVLKEGLARTAKFVLEHEASQPTGYRNIEVYKNMPPSWAQWLQQSPSAGSELPQHHHHHHNGSASLRGTSEKFHATTPNKRE